jgi:hypothetical protein
MGLFARIAGVVGAFFQIGGPAGPAWKNNGGNLDGRNASDSAYVNVRGADPIVANDLVTLEYANAHYLESTGSAVVDFGAGKGGDTSSPTLITGQAGILATSKCQAWIDATGSTPDHSVDEHIMATAIIGVACSTIVPGAGFTITATTQYGAVSGKFNVIWRFI